MKKMIRVLVSSMLFFGFATLPASAETESSPSDDALACQVAGGEFLDLGEGVTTCTVVTVESATVPASHPNKLWVASTETTITAIYTTEVTTIAGAVVGCMNPGGQSVPEPYPVHCDPSRPDRNPGWTIIYGNDRIETTRWENTSSVTVQTGCLNHKSNAIEDWVPNPNCVPLSPI